MPCTSYKMLQLWCPKPPLKLFDWGIKCISIFTWIYQNHWYIQWYIHARYIQFKFDISEIYHFRCIHYGYTRSGYIHHVYKQREYIRNGYISLNGYIKITDISKKYTLCCLANQVINPITYTGKVWLCVRLHCLLLIELTSWGESLRLRWHPWDICGIAEHFPLTFLSRRWVVINILHNWPYMKFWW